MLPSCFRLRDELRNNQTVYAFANLLSCSKTPACVLAINKKAPAGGSRAGVESEVLIVRGASKIFNPSLADSVTAAHMVPVVLVEVPARLLTGLYTNWSVRKQVPRIPQSLARLWPRHSQRDLADDALTKQRTGRASLLGHKPDAIKNIFVVRPCMCHWRRECPPSFKNSFHLSTCSGR